MNGEPLPWGDFLLAVWPLWLILAGMGAVWWVERRAPRRHVHTYVRVGYGGAGWSLYRCPCGATEIDA